jgi:hypothetical protein
MTMDGASSDDLDGLKDRARPGRPRVFGAFGGGRGQGLACELSATTGVPLSRWSSAELARELVLRGVVAFISAATAIALRRLRTALTAEPGDAFLSRALWSYVDVRHAKALRLEPHDFGGAALVIAAFAARTASLPS